MSQLTQTALMIGDCRVTLFHEAGDKHMRALFSGKYPLVASSLIVADENYAHLMELASQLGKTLALKKLRLSTLQLSVPAEEWSLIRAQSLCLARNQHITPLNISWAHLCLPTEHMLLRFDPQRVSEIEKKALDRLLHQFNAAGWATYCDWMGEEMMGYLKGFKPEALDEYQLQAHLEDFLHEIRSPLRATVRKSVEDAIHAQLELVADDQQKLLSLEKSVVSGREKLKTLTVYQFNLLGEIVSGICSIEEAHPELVPLKLTCALLSELIGNQLDIPGHAKLSWGQELLLIQLLDQQLHVIPMITSGPDTDRLQFAFFIRLALAELSNKYLLDDLILMSRSWGDNNRGNSRAEYLRHLVLANSKALSGGLPRDDGKGGKRYFRGNNLEMLAFIPEKLQVRGQEHELSLLLIDPETGHCRGCTSEGLHLLRRLNLI